MNAYQAILTLRAVRHFQDLPLPGEVLTRILQAGRWTGSAKNTQPWQFVVVRDRQMLDNLAACGHYAGHLRGAAVVVVIVMKAGWSGSFDSGRVTQNMMLAAWVEGVGSCIASLQEEERARSLLGVPADHRIQTSISFGYPLPDAPRTIEGRPMEEILASLGRRSLEEIVHWDQW